jgi:hypothetical protein
MSDADFWLTVRRALIMVARAVYKRYGHSGMCIILGVDVDVVK